MDYEVFYARCARLLDAEHDFHEPPGPVSRPRHDGSIRNTYKNRWNGREPGNGRYPGHGIVRHHGGGIHVSLHTPPLLGFYKDPEEAIAAIARAIGVQETYSEAEIEQIKAKHSEANVAAKAVVLQPEPAPNDIVIIARYFRLRLTQRSQIAESMGISVLASSAETSDYERFRAVINEIRKQNRIPELWGYILRIAETES